MEKVKKILDEKRGLLSALEFILYFVPLLPYGYSYSTYDEATGESGSEVVRGVNSLLTALWGPSGLCILMLAGIVLAVVSAVLNSGKISNKSEAAVKIGKWIFFLSTIWLLAMFLMYELFGKSTA